MNTSTDRAAAIGALTATINAGLDKDEAIREKMEREQS